jgi:hypothetical protein
MAATRTKKILRSLFSAVLLGFSGFRLVQLVVVVAGDPSGVTLAADVGAPVPLALALRVALPFHLLSVAVLLQRPYITPSWGRTAWLATVITGSWLGIVVLIRGFLWINSR